MEKNKITQAEFIRNHNEKHRKPFNPELFVKNDNDIILELEKAIVSCQRRRAFTLKVVNFTVVEDYDEIKKILSKYEKTRKKSDDENRFEYINLKDSAIKLLIVDYYIAINKVTDDPKEKTSKNLRVYIEVPRVVNKYYYKIFGNLYASTSQVIESTYNNSATANIKSTDMVTLKTMFMASRFYRYEIEDSKEINLVNTEGNKMKGVYYQSKIFDKFVLAIKYILARYGYYGTLEFLKVPDLFISAENPKDSNLYTCKIHKLYVNIPKYIYDRDQVAQSLYYTICVSLNRDIKNHDLNFVYTRDCWLMNLGKSFSTDTVEKGLSILESLESIYDLSSQEHLRLPDFDKKNIYDVILWILREYPYLRTKDNLDISMKRLRSDAEYFALLYVMKISSGIYRISDKGNKISLQKIEQVINTYPDFLLKAIVKDSLINGVNAINDLDAFIPLKYSFKGVSGLGEDATAIPDAYRHVHKSHLARLDLNAVSSSDPGLTGIITPTAVLYNGEFSDKQEKNTWREEVDQLLDDYKRSMGLKDLLEMKRDVSGFITKHDEYRLETMTEQIEILDSIIPGIVEVEKEQRKLIPLILEEDTSK